MAVFGPISVSLPSPISKQTGIGIVAATTGLLGTEIVSSSLISRTSLTGDGALIAGVGTKAGLGLGMWYAAAKSKAGGNIQQGLTYLGVGSFMSIALDVIHRVWPSGTASLAAKLGARAPAYAAAPIRVRAPTVAPAVVTAALPVAPVTAPIEITIKK